MSFSNISRSRVSEDLDDDTIATLKQSNKSAKAFFEASATKYKFGGSLADLREDIPVTKKTNKVLDQRSWVLESINRHFDVIVEENENDTDDDESYHSDSDSDSDDVDIYLDNEEENTGKLKASSQMQNLLKSVVSQITSKDRNLDGNVLLNNLRRKLENRQ